MVAQSDNPLQAFEAIATKFRNSVDPTLSSVASQKVKYPQDPGGSGYPARVSLESIQAPALLLAHDLRIIWQNESAASQLWHRPEIEEKYDQHEDIFDIILSPRFQSIVRNWRQWVAFFIQQALALVSIEELEILIAHKGDRQRETLQAILTDIHPSTAHTIFSGHLRQNFDGELTANYLAIGLSIEQNRLLMFESYPLEDLDSSMAHKIDGSPASPLANIQTEPIKLPFIILAARLNNADILAGEMLAKDYARLLFRLWGVTKEIIEQHHGVLAHYESSILLGYFLASEKNGFNPIDVIRCALELKSRMADLGREWKIQKGWLHDIELNIGIHVGNEYITSLTSSFGENLIPLGDTICVASNLSALARQGQIWTSKNVIDLLTSNELDALRFGIFRSDQARQLFIPRCFSRIQDLLDMEKMEIRSAECLGAYPATQIFDYQGKG